MRTMRNLPRHGAHIALALLLTLAGGGTAAQTTTPSGTVELSPTPPNQTQAVPPNIVVTFDDSGSMAWDYMSDTAPFVANKAWTSGPWYCAGMIDASASAGLGALVMNGVYYNPNVTYKPPINADGSSFPNADSSLLAVQNDGVTANRPLSPSGATTTTNFLKGIGWYKTSTSAAWTWGPFPSGKIYYSTNPQSKQPAASDNGTNGTAPTAWVCPYDKINPTSAAGPYYYRYTGPALTDNGYGAPSNTANLYTVGNWTAVAVPPGQYQNWANWWAYYHTRNQMARTALSRVFGDASLASATADGGFGSNIRVAWQVLNNSSYLLPAKAIISSLIDTAACTSGGSASPTTIQQQGTTKTPPACYRSAFFNWIFQVPASGGTPTRSAMDRAGKFFMRGKGNTGGTGDLTDPYWQPPALGKGDGNELSCRQNFHMLVTDGLWNGGADGPTRTSLTLPSSLGSLPDGVAFPGTGTAGVTAIYAPQADAGNKGYASLSDVAFHYWVSNLRSDLYDPANGKFVAPYIQDTKTGVVPTTTMSGSKVAAANVNNELYFNPLNDPANWPHMSEYLVGLGVSGVLNFSTDTDCKTGAADSSDACLLRQGKKNSSGAIGWPQPNGSGNGVDANIDDTWHAALAGRGQFFNASNPQNLVDQLSGILTSITARATQPTASAINASVLAAGALAFNTGYNSSDWTGVLQAVTLNADGSTGGVVWDAGAILSDASKTPVAGRQILTASMSSGRSVATGMAFQPSAAFDASEKSGLTSPASTDSANDTLATRVNYLRGDRTMESSGVMRKRNSLLGAIIDSQAVYVSYPSSGYTGTWPAGSPEAAAGAQSYDSFVSSNANRPGTLYVGANDGMLHAFDAALARNADGSYGPGQAGSAGQERWAYVPRGVYGNLGNLTSVSKFKFAPTVDATPVARDVFFGSDNKWHTLLVGGLRLGGRGVYALDVTNPAAVKESTASSSVLWEFDADAPASTSSSNPYNPADLGYTFGQPNIGRLANGKWAVLIPAGYFPDCSQPDQPANCQTAGGTPPKGFSALFVLDAQTGAVIAELKTPTNISGVTSYGLSSPVLGDYNNDQIDDVAFAGDLAGNLWRFDLGSANPSGWSVTLAYQPATQGAQPITVMPRLFPDPATNRFMVVFGTGKYLGAGDNTSNSASTQSVYGIRDVLDGNGRPKTITRGTLQAQTLSEVSATASTDPNYGATLRKLTNNPLSASAGGWYFDLSVPAASGERVVVTPGALFNTNTAVISTVIPGSSDPCNPTVQGAVMFVDAATGGAGSGVSSLGGGSYVGARVNNVRITGSLQMATPVGGGKVILPGITLTGKSGDASSLLTGDSAIWRRRSWAVLNNEP